MSAMGACGVELIRHANDWFRRTGEVRGVAAEFPLSTHQAAIRSPAEQGEGGSISHIPWAPNRTGLTRRFFFGAPDL